MNCFIARNGLQTCGLMLFITTITPVKSLALVCPEKDTPYGMKAVYVKYQVIDEEQIRLNQQAGHPEIIGDEFRELYSAGIYRMERLYGRLLADDMDHFNKQMAIAIEKGKKIEQRQKLGEDVPLEEIDNIPKEFSNNAYKLVIKEYNRVKVSTPGYVGQYNSVSKRGFGYRRLKTNNNMNALPDSMNENKEYFASELYSLINKLGYLNKTSNTRNILKYECTLNIINTDTVEWNRELGKVEICISRINGEDIVLSAAMGKPGRRYSIQAIKIEPRYMVNKSDFCLPDYVKMN